MAQTAAEISCMNFFHVLSGFTILSSDFITYVCFAAWFFFCLQNHKVDAHSERTTFVKYIDWPHHHTSFLHRLNAQIGVSHLNFYPLVASPCTSEISMNIKQLNTVCNQYIAIVVLCVSHRLVADVCTAVTVLMDVKPN